MRRDIPRGYVLLAVLAAMVLMVTVLASLANLSLRRSLAAADAQVALQQRIGTLSLERNVFGRSMQVFDTIEKELPTGVPFPSVLRTAVTFGGVTYDVVLADEDAKMNLNTIYHAAGPARCQSALTQMVGPSGTMAIRLLPAVRPSGFLVPAPADESEEETPAPTRLPAFRSWGEVFDLSRLTSNAGNDAVLPILTQRLTCWGAEAVNIRRAADSVIESAAGCVLSAAGAKRLVSRYRESPTMGLALLIQREAKTDKERQQLRTLVSETSSHFSLWIDASAVGRRSHRIFSVWQTTEDGTTLNERFAY